MSFTLYVIAGPTASGKSALAESLSLEFNIPIISADSRQFFNELSIGTAKPNLKKLPGIPYYFIGHKSIYDEYNAGDYERDVLALIEELKKKYSSAILCGGSGLYVNAVCNGFDALPKADLDLRNELLIIYRREGLQAIIKMLPEEIFELLNSSDKKNPQRIMRHVEISRSGGKADSLVMKRPFEIKKYLVHLDRNLLYDQINERVDLMMKTGLLNEAKEVYNHRTLNSLQTVGYTELFDYIERKYSLETAVQKIKQHTRNYAKRQITWFTKDSSYNKGTPEDLFRIISDELKAG